MTITKQDQKIVFSLLNDFIEFADFQEKEGLIDGVCDPTPSIYDAKRLLKKYDAEKEELVFAL
jgi:hypothetical protein